jgi:hypothetical protein
MGTAAGRFDDILIDVGTADKFLDGGQLLPEVRTRFSTLLARVFLGVCGMMLCRLSSLLVMKLIRKSPCATRMDTTIAITSFLHLCRTMFSFTLRDFTTNSKLCWAIYIQYYS